MAILRSRRLIRGAAHVRRFFRSWRFGVFSVATVILYHLLLGAILLVPQTASGPLGDFAQDFRRWCLDYDDAQGINPAFLIPLVLGPLMLGLITTAIYGSQWRKVLHRRRAMLRCVAGAAVVVAAVGAGLFLVGINPGETQAPQFPAERLRTHMQAPDFRLTNQDGQPIAASDYRGDIVVLTGVYARCGATCPLVLAQIKRVTSRLTQAQQAQVHILAVTLDPEHDTQAVLAELAESHGVYAPAFHMLTGSSREVATALSQIGILRTWNAERGVIDHNNVFLVLDRDGALAYRFSIGDLQERWMLEALQLLLAETGPKP